MNAFDYFTNPEISRRISLVTGKIPTAHDREDCAQEIYAEMYDFMPLDTEEAIRLVDRIAKRFKRARREVLENELDLADDVTVSMEE